MANLSEDGDIIDAKEVGRMLGLTPTTVIRYQQQKFIPGNKIGYIYRFSRAEIAKLVPGAIESAARGADERAQERVAV